MRKRRAWHRQGAGISLNADSEDDVLGNVLPFTRLDRERVAGFGNSFDLFGPLNLNTDRVRGLAPLFKKTFTRVGLERNVASKGNHGRLRHDVLPLLIIKYRVG